MRIPKGGVAFFDSGIGGLTVLHECAKRMQNETFYYFGDNTHAPYGNRSPKTIKKFVFRAFEKIARLKVKAAVVACNTATALCVEELRKKYPFPIIGAEPALFLAAKRGGEVLVLATDATTKSPRFLSLCARANLRYPKARFTVAPCPHLAGAIERHLTDEDFDYTPFLPQATPQAVVLGCTHYIYLKERVEKFYGAEVYDGNEGIAERLRYFLLSQNRDSQPLATPLIKEPKNPQIFFLGSRKRYNRHVFEQMFVNIRK